MGCDGWGSRLTIYTANSPIIIDHHRSPTLREAIDFSITSHFQMASTACHQSGSSSAIRYNSNYHWERGDRSTSFATLGELIYGSRVLGSNDIQIAEECTDIRFPKIDATTTNGSEDNGPQRILIHTFIHPFIHIRLIKLTKRNFVHKTCEHQSIAMFVKHTYNEIGVVHFVNFRNIYLFIYLRIHSCRKMTIK